MNFLKKVIISVMTFCCLFISANLMAWWFGGNNAINLPEDEAAHSSVVEWWYWTGNVEDDSGNIYGFQLTFFNIGSLSGLPLFSTHVAVTDVTAGVHNESEDFKYFYYPCRRNLVLENDNGFAKRLANGDYYVEGEVENYHYSFTIEDMKGSILHGDNGLVQMSTKTTKGQYYSRPRMKIEGSIIKGSEVLTVAGEAWMDHVWGKFLPLQIKGWDWFSLQLDDNSEIMFWIFRDEAQDSGSIDMVEGTYIDSSGQQHKLTHDQVDVTILSEWISPKTGGRFPQNWQISIPHLSIEVSVTSLLQDQEMPNKLWNYWEGLVKVEGVKSDMPIGGRGFVELSGYAGGWFARN